MLPADAAPPRFALSPAPGEPALPAAWRTESGEPPPARLVPVNDRLTADAALRRLRAGEHLLYQGNFKNARQLLSALGRRLERHASRAPQPPRPLEAFHAERRARQRESATLGRVLVALDADYRLLLEDAPDVREACEGVWGPPLAPLTVVALRTLQGMLGAAEWRRKGLAVPGLAGRLHPHYGVFVPTRTDYVELLLEAPAPTGRRVLDVGCGTGVLGLVLLQRGAASVVATDVDARAVACARDNAERLGLAARMTVLEQDLFPAGAQADLVVCNPPWVPEPPRTRVDRAVFDEGGRFLERFLGGLGAHLAPGGEGWLLLSNLAELLGLRAEGALAAGFERAGLALRWTRTTRAHHPRSQDASDPLHAARGRELTTLYCVGVDGARGARTAEGSSRSAPGAADTASSSASR